MRSQIHRTIKAHLLRVAFYLLLLLAACAIPFALASAKRRFAKQGQGIACVGVSHNLKCSCLTRNYRICYPSNPGRTGYHPLRSDGQPCAHATTPPVQWGHHIAGLRARIRQL